MNMAIKARDLIAAGWHEGRWLGPALRRARDLESTGLARADVLTTLEAEFPQQLAVILPRYDPAPLTEAIEADPPEEASHVATARQRMTEWLHVRVVKRELAEWIVRREGASKVLMTHHGSRGLGADVYQRGRKAAREWSDENAEVITPPIVRRV